MVNICSSTRLALISDRDPSPVVSPKHVRLADCMFGWLDEWVAG